MKVDVVIVGGGPAGAICAALLARQGWRVALVTGPRPRRAWVELLAPEGVLWLERQGFAAAIRTAAAPKLCPGIIDAWTQEPAVITDFALTRCTPGWVVERGRFDACLVEVSRNLGVHVIAEGGFHQLVSPPSTAPVVVESQVTGCRLEAEIVVDATGTASRLWPAAKRRLWFDRLVAVRSVTPAILPNADWMQLGWSSAGWWYLLPGDEASWQAVFMTDADCLPRSTTAQRSLLKQQFRHAFGCDPGFTPAAFETRSARTSCPKTFWSQRWLPLGDAAYSLDPLSGGGLTRAFQMAEQVTTALTDFFATSAYDSLQQLALMRVQEFRQNLAWLCAHYTTLASRFPRAETSAFWERRLPLPPNASASPATNL